MADDVSDKTITVIIGVVLVFLIVGNLAATVLTAAGNITTGTNLSVAGDNSTGALVALPLAALFGGSGIILIIVMIGFLKKVIKMSKG